MSRNFFAKKHLLSSTEEGSNSDESSFPIPNEECDIMGEYYWDTQIEYLRNSRDLFYNDDLNRIFSKDSMENRNPCTSD